MFTELQTVKTLIRLLWAVCQGLCVRKRQPFCIVLCSHRKVPKFSDARKLCCNQPKIQTKRPNCTVFCQKDTNGIANSEDPDQTARQAVKEQTDLNLRCLSRPSSVRKLWIIKAYVCCPITFTCIPVTRYIYGS